MPSLRGRSRPKSQADLLSNIKYSLGLKSPAIDFSIYLSISIYMNYICIYTHIICHLTSTNVHRDFYILKYAYVCVQ